MGRGRNAGSGLLSQPAHAPRPHTHLCRIHEQDHIGRKAAQRRGVILRRRPGVDDEDRPSQDAVAVESRLQDAGHSHPGRIIPRSSWPMPTTATRAGPSRRRRLLSVRASQLCQEGSDIGLVSVENLERLLAVSRQLPLIV